MRAGARQFWPMGEEGEVRGSRNSSDSSAALLHSGRKPTLLMRRLLLLWSWPSTCHIPITAIIVVLIPKIAININNQHLATTLICSFTNIYNLLYFSIQNGWHLLYVLISQVLQQKVESHVLRYQKKTKTLQCLPTQQTDKTDLVRAQRLVPACFACPLPLLSYMAAQSALLW